MIRSYHIILDLTSTIQNNYVMLEANLSIDFDRLGTIMFTAQHLPAAQIGINYSHLPFNAEIHQKWQSVKPFNNLNMAIKTQQML